MGTNVFELTIHDNSEAVKEALESQMRQALEAMGLTAEGHAKRNLTQNKSVDTGNLRNSIAHQVVPEEKAVYIGTVVEYGKFVELGTGKYAEGGRQDPWVYQDEKGQWHHTNGQRAKPFLKPAVADHVQEYHAVLKSCLAGERGDSGPSLMKELVQSFKEGQSRGEEFVDAVEDGMQQ